MPASATLGALVAVVAQAQCRRPRRRAVASSSSEAEATGRPVSSVDQRLEVEQHFQPALADLGLVGRVGRVPGRILEQIALDDRRHDGAVVAGADEALQHRVRRHLRGKLGQRLSFAGRRGQGRAGGRGGSISARPGRSASRARARRRRPAWRGCRRGRADMAGGEGVGCCAHCHDPAVSRYGLCSRPRPAGRRAGLRRRASSSTASRRRSRPS